MSNHISALVITIQAYFLILGLLAVTVVGPSCCDNCGGSYDDVNDPEYLTTHGPQEAVVKRISSGPEDIYDNNMGIGAVGVDLTRKESHLERTTGERKVDGLEHRLSNELA